MVNAAVKRFIEERGVTQKWLINKMNSVSPELDMNKQKMSAIMTNRRRLNCDEFLAICKVFEVSPDIFVQSA